VYDFLLGRRRDFEDGDAQHPIPRVIGIGARSAANIERVLASLHFELETNRDQARFAGWHFRDQPSRDPQSCGEYDLPVAIAHFTAGTDTTHRASWAQENGHDRPITNLVAPAHGAIAAQKPGALNAYAAITQSFLAR
jgi:hypothetical protein